MWRFEGFLGMDGPIYVGVEGSQHGNNFLSMHVLKAPWQEKGNCAIVESTHLNNMFATYNHHFAIYSKDKSKNIQLIPNAMWKVVFTSYKLNYPKSNFQEETLKKWLWETLRELKTRTSNEEGSNKVVLHNEEVLVHLKSIDGHAMCNVLKC
jgi:hypothetical protein